jgi:hypothetical protein
MEQLEICAAIIEPYFDLVRQTFADHVLEGGEQMSKVRRTRMLVDPSVRDSQRHYAACRDDGRLILVAPEATDLDVDNELIPLLSHEMGHAVDFLYPGSWVPPARPGQRAIWIGDLDSKEARYWKRRLWHERGDDQIEQMADAIAYKVMGKRIRYCGPCMVQCFSGGRTRPTGLR